MKAKKKVFAAKVIQHSAHYYYGIVQIVILELFFCKFDLKVGAFFLQVYGAYMS
jgi:hypothetical protein